LLSKQKPANQGTDIFTEISLKFFSGPGTFCLPVQLHVRSLREKKALVEPPRLRVQETIDNPNMTRASRRTSIGAMPPA
jgi:hypothetical protein